MASIAAGKKALMSMKLDTKGFGRAIRKFASSYKGSREQAARAIFFRLLEKIILKSPVDTGMMRGGWGATPGVIIPKANPAPPKKDRTEEGKKLSEFTEETTGTRIRLTVINRVPYAVYLEEGSSKQAPFGMVRISAKELEHELTGKGIPQEIFAVYQEVWAKLGLSPSAEFRGGALGTFAEARAAGANI